MNGYYQNSENLFKSRYQSATVPRWNEATCSSDSQGNIPVVPTSATVYYPTTPVFQKQWCYVDRVGGQYVVINSFDNLPLPDEPPTDLSHYSHSPPNLARYNAERQHQFVDGLEEIIEKMEKFKFKQDVVGINFSTKAKRQRCS